MSPVVPNAGAFSVKITGRPRMVTGGPSEPGWLGPPIHTGPPPVPTDSAIVASWGNVSIAATHTAFFNEVGSMRAYILTMFSHTIVPAVWPASAACCTDAGELMNPSGVPAPVSVMNETGAGTPEGFINSPASVQQAAEAGQTAGTIVWENIVKMYARMLPTSLKNAVWVAAIDTFPQLATMALSVGTGGGPVWIGGPNQPGSDGPPVTILGRPVIFTEKAPALGTTGDINFVDLSYYLIGDRQAVAVAASEHAFFQNDQVAYRIIERVDGRPWLQSALTPHNGSANTLSAFVQLASR